MDFPHCAINDLPGLLWSNVALLSITGIIVVSSFLSQFKDAAPYGRHATPEKEKQWGPPIPQRVAHFEVARCSQRFKLRSRELSDALPGVPFCLAVYLIYAGSLPAGEPFSEVRGVNLVMLCGWLLHYLYRGFITPFIMPYSSRTVALGIPLAGIVPNCIFGYLVATQLACTRYPSDWAGGPRYIIGVVLYAVGTAINRWADLKLRAGRLEMLRRRQAAAATAAGSGGGADAAAGAAAERGSKAVAAVAGAGIGAAGGGGGEGSAAGGMRESLLEFSRAGGGAPAGVSSSAASLSVSIKDGGAAGAGGGGGGGDIRERYFIPHGGLYDYIACPNYLGELIEWAGFAVGTWSWPALSWLLFCTSTFVPRALTHLRWYRDTFPEYPRSRKALIPFVL